MTKQSDIRSPGGEQQKRAAGNIQQAEIPTNIQLAAAGFPITTSMQFVHLEHLQWYKYTDTGGEKPGNTNTNQNKRGREISRAQKITIKATNRPPQDQPLDARTFPALETGKSAKHSHATSFFDAD